MLPILYMEDTHWIIALRVDLWDLPFILSFPLGTSRQFSVELSCVSSDAVAHTVYGGDIFWGL
jgi:hypothetical protein